MQYPYSIFLAVVAVYVLAVALIGFEGPVAMTIHFIRTSIVMAVLITFIPFMKDMFNGRPYKNRDFLLAGIILTELSNESFSVWNEIGRVFGVNRDVFSSPIAGLFSLFLFLGAVAFLKAADLEESNKWQYSLFFALLFGVLLVFVAPMFRDGW